MSGISAQLGKSVLFSPRTAKYVSSLIREGDKFNYHKWLQQARGEEAQAKQDLEGTASDRLALAGAGNQTSTSGYRGAWPNVILLNRRLRGIGKRNYDRAGRKIPRSTVRRRLANIREAWDDFQASRARDAVYRYLEAVFAIVEHYKVRRRINRLLRRAFEFADLPFDKHADPFTTVIRCTCDNEFDSKTISKWARALRYIAHCKVPRTRLKTFMKQVGGVNACADLYARYLGRGGR
jgi:hypothetical protein